MMIDLTGSLKEMSKLVLKAVFVAWNWNCNQLVVKWCRRLLFNDSLELQAL